MASRRAVEAGFLQYLDQDASFRTGPEVCGCFRNRNRLLGWRVKLRQIGGSPGVAVQNIFTDLAQARRRMGETWQDSAEGGADEFWPTGRYKSAGRSSVAIRGRDYGRDRCGSWRMGTGPLMPGRVGGTTMHIDHVLLRRTGRSRSALLGIGPW
jgi:hypothetical protein